MKFKNIANIALSTILVFSGTNIAIKLVDYKQAENFYNELYEELGDSNNTIDPTTNESNTSSSETSQTSGTSGTSGTSETVDEYTKQRNAYNTLKGKNEDYVFWVSVDNTNINYPVVQTSDNSTYLKKGFNKKKSSSGTIFMDTLNNFMTDKNVVLYGHNMNNKTMFNNLNKFKDRSFFNKNNKIRIKNTNNGKEYIYEVFSVYHSDNNFNYNTVVFNDNYTFENYISDIKEKSMFKKNIDISPRDKIITLTTCSYEFKGAKTSVHAKLVEVKNLNPNSIVSQDSTSENEENNSLSIHDMIEY